jgi:hypothetical protein
MVQGRDSFPFGIEPIFGNLPLRSIGLKQWDELVKTPAAAGLSPRSKEYVTGTLRRIMKHGYETGECWTMLRPQAKG